MDVNLSSLRTFLAVAKFQGITRALGEVHLSQPAVSRQIQGLEEYLGTKLFLRKGRYLDLTESGHVLQQYSIRVFQLLTEAQEEIDGLKGLIRGHLRISAASTVGIYIIPDLLGEFKSQYPGIEISLTISNKEEVLRQVKDGIVDLGFAGLPIPYRELAMEPYLEDDMVLIVSPQHQFAARNAVSTREFIEDVFILRGPGDHRTGVPASWCFPGAHNGAGEYGSYQEGGGREPRHIHRLIQGGDPGGHGRESLRRPDIRHRSPPQHLHSLPSRQPTELSGGRVSTVPL